MDDYKEESKKAGEAINRLMEEGVTDETYSGFKDSLEEFGLKFDSARKAEATNCFCGNEIPESERTEQEVSPSMYYSNRRTCSERCHNKWILGLFEGVGMPVGKGWMPIIEQLDKDISAIDPDYSITQVKEKFGTLRYYARYSEPEYPCGIESEEIWAVSSLRSDLYYKINKAENPDEWLDVNEVAEEVPDWKLKKWKESYERLGNLINKLQPIGALINAAEAASATTCEWCGDPGESRSGGWVLTLCDGCNEKKDAGIRPWDNEA